MIINIKNKKIHTLEKNDILICRGFPLGNPADWKNSNHPDVKIKVKSREDAILYYEEYLVKQILSGNPEICDAINKLIINKFLNKGFNLVCYCNFPQEDCHGRIIKEYVERAKYCINWFSNMRRMDEPLIYQNIRYWTPENFYQAMKVNKNLISERQKIALMNPLKAKIYGKTIKIREDWEEIKLKVMNKVVCFKFKKETSWGQKLKNYKKDIIEFNNWGDEFWGVNIYNNNGKNYLGEILTKIRNEN